jgi:DNA-binding GntR family transcriptional regulator
MNEMREAARTGDMDALVRFDSQFHKALVNASERRRLKNLWSMLSRAT